MEEKRTSIFENALIWFGAAVGLAEILSGTFLTPLGFEKGLLSIIVGHVIGCFLLFLAGYIGGKKRMSAGDFMRGHQLKPGDRFAVPEGI